MNKEYVDILNEVLYIIERLDERISDVEVKTQDYHSTIRDNIRSVKILLNSIEISE